MLYHIPLTLPGSVCVDYYTTHHSLGRRTVNNVQLFGKTGILIHHLLRGNQGYSKQITKLKKKRLIFTSTTT